MICDLEDLNRDCCVNCFNGLPAYGCPKQEEESKQLHELMHKKAEAVRQREYERGRSEAIDELLNRLKKIDDWEFASFTLCLIEEVAEKLKEQKNEID